MKSNVHLRIEGGARLLMSGNIEDFPDFACEWDVARLRASVQDV